MLQQRVHDWIIAGRPGSPADLLVQLLNSGQVLSLGELHEVIGQVEADNASASVFREPRQVYKDRLWKIYRERENDLANLRQMSQASIASYEESVKRSLKSIQESIAAGVSSSRDFDRLAVRVEELIHELTSRKLDASLKVSREMGSNLDAMKAIMSDMIKLDGYGNEGGELTASIFMNTLMQIITDVHLETIADENTVVRIHDRIREKTSAAFAGTAFGKLAG
jgi:hypothetical protein